MNQSFNQSSVEIEQIVPSTVWPYLASVNQDLSTTSDVEFKDVVCETPVVSRYDDVRVSALSVSLGASIRPPDFTLFKNNGLGSIGTYTWSFDEKKDQEVFIELQLPHSYANGTTLSPHCHIAVPTQTATNITFGLEYGIQPVGGTYGDTTILVNSIACPAPYVHTILPLGTIVGTGQRISSILVGRLFRPVTVGDYVGGVFLLSFDVHISIDTMGSATLTSK